MHFNLSPNRTRRVFSRAIFHPRKRKKEKLQIYMYECNLAHTLHRIYGETPSPRGVSFHRERVIQRAKKARVSRVSENGSSRKILELLLQRRTTGGCRRWAGQAAAPPLDSRLTFAILPPILRLAPLRPEYMPACICWSRGGEPDARADTRGEGQDALAFRRLRGLTESRELRQR